MPILAGSANVPLIGSVASGEHRGDASSWSGARHRSPLRAGRILLRHDGGMDTDAYEMWGQDEALLASLGRALFSQRSSGGEGGTDRRGPSTGMQIRSTASTDWNPRSAPYSKQRPATGLTEALHPDARMFRPRPSVS